MAPPAGCGNGHRRRYAAIARPACHPPSFRQTESADMGGIISLFLTSPTMRLSDLDEYAETMLAHSASPCGWRGQVQVFGAAKYAVRVQVGPNQLAARSIGLNEVEPRCATGT